MRVLFLFLLRSLRLCAYTLIYLSSIFYADILVLVLFAAIVVATKCRFDKKNHRASSAQLLDGFHNKFTVKKIPKRMLQDGNQQ